MALVTLAVAKSHLRVTTHDSDADILLKVDQASAMILDYLKGRAHYTATIAATLLTSSEASPTVITTQSPHAFVNGATVVIAGHLTSVPSLNGAWVVSNATASSFTIPVAVTTAGTGGTVTSPWTDVTVPGPVQAATLVLLSHLHEHRGDEMERDGVAWEAIGRILVRFRDPALA